MVLYRSHFNPLSKASVGRGKQLKDKKRVQKNVLLVICELRV